MIARGGNLSETIVTIVALLIASGIVVGFVTGYSDFLVAVIVTSLAVGSAVLAPAIVFGYAVKAAEREDRELGR